MSLLGSLIRPHYNNLLNASSFVAVLSDSRPLLTNACLLRGNSWQIPKWVGVLIQKCNHYVRSLFKTQCLCSSISWFLVIAFSLDGVMKLLFKLLSTRMLSWCRFQKLHSFFPPATPPSKSFWMKGSPTHKICGLWTVLVEFNNCPIPMHKALG